VVCIQFKPANSVPIPVLTGTDVEQIRSVTETNALPSFLSSSLRKVTRTASASHTSRLCLQSFLTAPVMSITPHRILLHHSEVTSAQSLHSFRRHLKTFLSQRSFLDVIVTL